MKIPTPYNGLVVVDKAPGMTSHDVVHAARKLFHTKRIGHTGTLDPDATGVLVLCIGQATRLAEYLSASRKNYVAEVVFGIETDTQDASGERLAERDASSLTEEAVRAILPRFRGTIEQIPPMVSALHHNGKRLYELAREGITVERAARSIEIDRLEMLAFSPGTHSCATLEITCSTGTYIRTLAADIGAAAGTGAIMQSLRRTWVGEPGAAYTLEAAHTLESLRERADAGTLAAAVLPLQTALAGWLQAALSEENIARVRHGQAVPVASLEEETAQTFAAEEERPVALFNGAGELCAIARLTVDRLQPVKVFI